MQGDVPYLTIAGPAGSGAEATLVSNTIPLPTLAERPRILASQTREDRCRKMGLLECNDVRFSVFAVAWSRFSRSDSIDEEREFSALYAPLGARLGTEEGALGKLSFSIRRVVDVVAWAQSGEELLDLRKTGPFKGRGALWRQRKLVSKPHGKKDRAPTSLKQWLVSARPMSATWLNMLPSSAATLRRSANGRAEFQAGSMGPTTSPSVTASNMRASISSSSRPALAASSVAALPRDRS